MPDRLKVWETLDLFASFVPGESNWRLLLEQWGLTGKENATFASLSGGQRQRLFIALALVTAIQDPWLGLGINLTELLILTGMLIVAAALSIRLAETG